MQIIAFIVVAFLIILPFISLFAQLLSNITVILDGPAPVSPLLIGTITVIVFGLIGFALRFQFKQSRILLPFFFCAMLIYATQFSAHLYDSVVENLVFSKSSHLYKEDVEIIGTKARLSRGSEFPYGFINSARGSNLRSKIYITPELFEALHGDGDVRLYMALPSSACFVRITVQDTGEAKRLVYSKPFDIKDLANCPRAGR